MELTEGVLGCYNYHSVPSFSSMLQLPQYTFIQLNATITTVHLHSVPCHNYHSTPSVSSMPQLPQYTLSQFHATITTPLILGGFSNFCRYYTRSQTGKSTGYRPTLKPLLNTFSEEFKVLNESQCGFCKQYSTVDSTLYIYPLFLLRMSQK
jgi:hypothetical protein